MIDKFLRILKSENLNLFVVIGQLIVNYPKIFKGAKYVAPRQIKTWSY
jgi:hypothetical protein